jgi:enamine deaminase RidA (YjgF/YER057c/UK114 family)
MQRKLISSGSIFEEQVAYSRAVVVGNMIFVSGCTGFNYETTTIAESIEEQTEQTFKNIESALLKAGSALKDIVRVHYILKDNAEFEKCWPIFRIYFGDIRPACTVFEAKMHDERIKIEIEVTAVKTD